MNREIKFRAWNKDRKEWAHLIIGKGTAHTLSHTGGEHEDWQQFTGLKDENGKEIYEGDVVHLGGDGTIFDETGNWWGASGEGGFARPEQEVKWNEEYAGFAPFCIYDTDCGVQMHAEKTEVIGNIYENKDLLV